MIISTQIKVNDRTLIKHESDCGKMIRQIETGREYASAVDVSSLTDIPTTSTTISMNIKASRQLVMLVSIMPPQTM